ncbi:MAG: DUF4097 family beta strand repeat-containing protein [Terriglobales bacterium]
MKTSTVVFALLLLCTLPLLAADEGDFDRTLNVTGPVELDVTTGSGHINVHPGNSGVVAIHGHVRAGECCSIHLFGGGGDPAQMVKQIIANPPIEQSGNVIRVGHFGQSQEHDNISISYDITVPPQTRLTSHTGSGRQEISGISGPAEITAGSGSLRISDIAGDVRAHTGSGRMELSNLGASVRAVAGSGTITGDRLGAGSAVQTSAQREGASSGAAGSDLSFQTGSGGIRVHDLTGIVRAHAGSGSIDVEGRPTGDWSLGTGSGSVTLRLPAEAAFDLYARTGSGRITSDRPLTIQGNVSRRALRGKVGNGGVHLDVHTGSGSIRIQ